MIFSVAPMIYAAVAAASIAAGILPAAAAAGAAGDDRQVAGRGRYKRGISYNSDQSVDIGNVIQFHFIRFPFDLIRFTLIQFNLISLGSL